MAVLDCQSACAVWLNYVKLVLMVASWVVTSEDYESQRVTGSWSSWWLTCDITLWFWLYPQYQNLSLEIQNIWIHLGVLEHARPQNDWNPYLTWTLWDDFEVLHMLWHPRLDLSEISDIHQHPMVYHHFPIRLSNYKTTTYVWRYTLMFRSIKIPHSPSFSIHPPLSSYWTALDQSL